MGERRGKGEDSISFEHADAYRVPPRPRCRNALRELRADAAIGITKAPPVNYTVRTGSPEEPSTQDRRQLEQAADEVPQTKVPCRRLASDRPFWLLLSHRGERGAG